MRRSKKSSKLRVTGLCVGNSPGTGKFPAQMASNTENGSIWWRHYELLSYWIYLSIDDISRRAYSRKISRSLGTLCVKIFESLWNLTGSQEQRCRVTCQLSNISNYSNQYLAASNFGTLYTNIKLWNDPNATFEHTYGPLVLFESLYRWLSPNLQ